MFKSRHHNSNIEPIQTRRTSFSTNTFIALSTGLLTFVFVIIIYMTNMQFRGWIQKCLSPFKTIFQFNNHYDQHSPNDENVVNFGLPGTKFTKKDINEVAEEAEKRLNEERHREL